MIRRLHPKPRRLPTGAAPDSQSRNRREAAFRAARMITPAWVLLLPSISGTERRRDFLPPNPALLLPCNSLLAPTTVSRAGQITARKTNQPDPEAGSRRARASDILLGPKRRIRLSRAGRAGPSLGAASEMFPPDPAPLLLSLAAATFRGVGDGGSAAPSRFTADRAACKRCGSASPFAECR